jgi:hypothetical protein
MTKPYVSTVLSNEDDDDPSIVDGLFAKLDMYNTSAAEASKIADAKQAPLPSSSGIDEHISAAEARDTANVAETCEAREAQAQQGVFSQLRLHMSTLKSPFNRNDTPTPVEVLLDETPRTGMTRHANNLFDDLYHNHPINGGMEFNGLQSPNHDPLMPIPESPTATTRTVNFKINNHDDSNTPTRKFNFGEKSHPYPRFNAGIDNIATENPYVLITKSTLIPIKSILSTLLLLPPCPMPLSILKLIPSTLMLILNHHCTRKVTQMSFRNHTPMTFDLTDQVQLPTRIMMKHFNEVLWNAAQSWHIAGPPQSILIKLQCHMLLDPTPRI